jgi:hypothetical protein
MALGLVACDGNPSGTANNTAGAAGAATGGTGATAAGGTGGTAGMGGTVSTGGAATGGNSTGGAATGGSATTTGTGGSATTTGTGGMDCGPCDWSCCGSTCINLTNDIHNCGACGQVCPGPTPFCDNGLCGKAPCSGQLCGAGQLCCGSACCQSGDICCNIPGPVVMGPVCTPPTAEGTCPLGCQSCVCASPDTPVATPDGERPISDLKVGDIVYSRHAGQIAAVPIIEAVHVPAPDHVIVRVTLENGRTIDMSPKHPTADGRTFADLRPGDSLQGQRIHSLSAEPFRFPETYDILPASDSGTYFAAGALVGSTLSPSAPQQCGSATTRKK